MKLLHTSDWHLGMTFQGRNIREDQEYFIDQICELIETEKVDAVLLAGDVFDRSIASVDAIDLYNKTMKRICMDMKTPILLIAGNHDGAERVSSCHELLKESGLYIAGILDNKCECVSFDDVDIYMLPWISTDQVRFLYPDKVSEITSLEAAYRIVCDDIRAGINPDKKNILISHAFITKAETSTSDRAAVVGLATQVGASVFDGFDYVALGHIHKPQDITDSIRYSGTPMPYSFGSEETQEKSVTIIDTENMSKKIVPLKLLRKRTTLVDTYENLLAADVPEEVRTGYVRLEVVDTYVSYDILGRLKEIYPNILEVSGKSIDSEESTISITLDEFRERETNPLEIFKQFCLDNKQDCNDSLIDLFNQAVAEYEKEVQS